MSAAESQPTPSADSMEEARKLECPLCLRWQRDKEACALEGPMVCNRIDRAAAALDARYRAGQVRMRARYTDALSSYPDRKVFFAIEEPPVSPPTGEGG